MTDIEAIKTFIAGYSGLPALARVHVDFLPETNDVYSIEETPTERIVSTNIDGSSTRQVDFVFAARFLYSDEARNNLSNSGFFEGFANWLEACTKQGNLPTLDTGKTATKIEALSSGYLYGVVNDLSAARYQIQCRLTYDMD